MYPIAHFCSWSLGTGAGTHTSPGVWSDALSGDCAGSCDDLVASLDEADYGMCRSSASAGTRDNGRSEFTFGDPPQNVTISNLTLVVWVRTSSGNAPIIDSSPTLQLFVDPGTGVRAYQAGTQTVTAAANRNTQAPAGTFQKLTYAWPAKPAGGAWTRAELLSGSFKAGFESSAVSGHGSGVDATTGGSSASLDWADVYIELETTPTGAFIEPNRVVLSHGLRLLSAGQRTLDIDVGPEFGGVEPGDMIWCSHELLPWSPGTDAWKQIPLFCAAVRDRFDPPGRSLTLWDLREVGSSFWSPFRIVGIDDQKTGLAIYHRGGGWSTLRAQVAYGRRPGDGLYGVAAANTPIITRDGLLIQGGGDTNYFLNSTFSLGGPGDTFTSWAKTVSGSATGTEDTNDYLVDVVGLQRSIKLSTTAAAESAYVSQTVAGFAANTKLCVRTWYKNDSGPDYMFVWIIRSVDGLYWDDVAGTWGAATSLRPVLSRSIARWTSKQFNVGANPTDITVRIGYGVWIGTAANTAHVYAVELQLATTNSWIRRELLPTTSAQVTRVEDLAAIDNGESWRVWRTDRGYVAVTVTPMWSHADLGNLEVRYVITSAFDGAAGAAKMNLRYTRINAGSGVWELAIGVTAGASVPVSGASLATAGTSYRLAARWTSVAVNEWGLGGQALDIWVDGVKGTGSTGNAEQTSTNVATVLLGTYGSGGSGFIDGCLSNLVIDSRVPSDAEMERM